MREIQLWRMVSGNRRWPHTIKWAVVAKTEVDDVFYSNVDQNHWRLDTNGYAHRYENLRKIYLHREIWKLAGRPFTEQLDHVDTNTLNNQLGNLRPVDYSQNYANSVLQKRSTSGFKGVSLNKKAKTYQAMVTVQKVKIYLGVYTTAIEAALAYDDAALHYFGEYARTNKSLGLL